MEELEEYISDLHKQHGGTKPVTYFGLAVYLEQHYGREQAINMLQDLKNENKHLHTMCRIGVCIEMLETR